MEEMARSFRKGSRKGIEEMKIRCDANNTREISACNYWWFMDKLLGTIRPSFHVDMPQLNDWLADPLA